MFVSSLLNGCRKNSSTNSKAISMFEQLCCLFGEAKDLYDETYEDIPEAGDPLLIKRIGYWHHGLYAGEGKVIHYSGLFTFMEVDGVVEEVWIDEFARGNGFLILAHPNRHYFPRESLRRARSKSSTGV